MHGTMDIKYNSPVHFVGVLVGDWVQYSSGKKPFCHYEVTL